MVIAVCGLEAGVGASADVVAGCLALRRACVCVLAYAVGETGVTYCAAGFVALGFVREEISRVGGRDSRNRVI